MHPPYPRVESLVDEELSPGHCSISIEPLSADHLQLRAEEKRSVRIDQQQRMVIGGVRRRNGNSIRSAWLCLRFCGQGGCLIGASVEGLQLFQVDSFDVTPDAALGKRQRHPGLEMLNHARFHCGMLAEI